jgi:hypothetical protein
MYYYYHYYYCCYYYYYYYYYNTYYYIYILLYTILIYILYIISYFYIWWLNEYFYILHYFAIKLETPGQQCRLLQRSQRGDGARGIGGPGLDQGISLGPVMGTRPGKRWQKTMGKSHFAMENHYFQWVNQLFLWLITDITMGNHHNYGKSTIKNHHV